MIHHATCAPSGIMNHLLSHGSSVPHAKSGTTRVVVPRTLQFVITASKLSAYLHFYFSSSSGIRSRQQLDPMFGNICLCLCYSFLHGFPRRTPGVHLGKMYAQDAPLLKTMIFSKYTKSIYSNKFPE